MDFYLKLKNKQALFLKGEELGTHTYLGWKVYIYKNGQNVANICDKNHRYCLLWRTVQKFHDKAGLQNVIFNAEDDDNKLCQFPRMHYTFREQRKTSSLPHLFHKT